MKTIAVGSYGLSNKATKKLYFEDVKKATQLRANGSHPYQGLEEKISSRKKFESMKKLNFFPLTFFVFIWIWGCYRYGRPFS